MYDMVITHKILWVHSYVCSYCVMKMKEKQCMSKNVFLMEGSGL